jgi:hypothetical protein
MYNCVGDPEVTEADIDKVGNWNVNFTRWMFIDYDVYSYSVEEYRQFIASQCELLDAKLPAFERNGVKVCIALGSYPGHRTGGDKDDAGYPYRIFHETGWQEEFIRTWETIATHFKDNETVVMYDLMNEPYTGNALTMPGLLKMPDLFLKTAQMIRAMGDDTEIVYEPSEEFTLDVIEPFDVPGIVYSVHAYAPYDLTHQGMSLDVLINTKYPGASMGQYWDSRTLRRYYSDVKRFSDNHHVRILVGEFGCVRWAPDNSAYNYMKDCIEFFEEEGWDWVNFSLQPTPCHANSGATGWSPEYDTVYKSQCAPDEETDRLQLLRSYFEKNE